VRFLGRGDVLYIARRNEIALVDSKTGAVTKTLTGHSDNVRSISVSSDGKSIVSGSDDGFTRVWDVASGTSYFMVVPESYCVAKT
jgi:WD40 repeat protein